MMPTHKWTLWIVLTAFMVLTAPAQAKLSDQPGYVDLEFIEIPDDAETIQDINLGPVLKDVAREARQNNDHTVADLLAMVRGLRMRSFSLDENSRAMAEKAVQKVARNLARNQWDNLMKFKDGRELTTISSKYHQDKMVGLMIVVYSPEKEVMFINIVGDLDLGKLMKLAGDLDTEDLEDYLEKVEDGGRFHLE